MTEAEEVGLWEELRKQNQQLEYQLRTVLGLLRDLKRQPAPVEGRLGAVRHAIDNEVNATLSLILAAVPLPSPQETEQ